MSKYIYSLIVKDGDNKRLITYEIDQSKPKQWIEGNEYKFNRRLLFSALIRNDIQGESKMASMHKPAVLAVQEIGEAETGQSGVVSCRTVLFKDLTHEDLTVLFGQSPDFVIAKRPDWVKKYHPNFIH